MALTVGSRSHLLQGPFSRDDKRWSGGAPGPVVPAHCRRGAAQLMLDLVPSPSDVLLRPGHRHRADNETGPGANRGRTAHCASLEFLYLPGYSAVSNLRQLNRQLGTGRQGARAEARHRLRIEVPLPLLVVHVGKEDLAERRGVRGLMEAEPDRFEARRARRVNRVHDNDLRPAVDREVPPRPCAGAAPRSRCRRRAAPRSAGAG